MEKKEKYEIEIDGIKIIVDDFGYEYTQLDGEESGRSDDFSMIRDVGGLNNKLYATFNDMSRWYGKSLSNLLKLIEKKECMLKYFDPKEYDFIEKKMYLTISKIGTRLIDNEIYIKDSIEIHFIQMDVDEI